MKNVSFRARSHLWRSARNLLARFLASPRVAAPQVAALGMTLLFLIPICEGIAAPEARNPFTPLPLPISKPPVRESLTDYSLDELELKAVIWGTDKSVALFQAVDGKSFIAKVGTAVGKKGGKVIKINDKIVIVQGDFGKKTFSIRGR